MGWRYVPDVADARMIAAALAAANPDSSVEDVARLRVTDADVHRMFDAMLAAAPTHSFAIETELVEAAPDLMDALLMFTDGRGQPMTEEQRLAVARAARDKASNRPV